MLGGREKIVNHDLQNFCAKAKKLKEGSIEKEIKNVVFAPKRQSKPV